MVNVRGWLLAGGPAPASGSPHPRGNAIPQCEPMKPRLLSKYSQTSGALLDGSWRLFSCFLYSSSIGDLLPPAPDVLVYIYLLVYSYLLV